MLPERWIRDRKNIRQIGFDDLNGKPAFQMAMQKVDDRYYLYTASFAHNGWNIVEVTDPENPRNVKWIEGPWFYDIKDGQATMKIQVDVYKRQERNYMSTVLFEDLDLNPQILRAIKEMGFEEATPIQAQSIPWLLYTSLIRWSRIHVFWSRISSVKSIMRLPVVYRKSCKVTKNCRISLLSLVWKNFPKRIRQRYTEMCIRDRAEATAIYGMVVAILIIFLCK